MNFKKLFEYSDLPQGRILIRFFGIKLSFQKREFAKKRKQNLFYEFKKNKKDITTLPKATGQIRDIQLANFAILKELDYVCKKNNIPYWLDFGTALGALRHKGYIPWDDDIDVGMLRGDFERLVEIFDKDKNNPDLYITFGSVQKIQHKRNDKIFIDIFSYYHHNRTLNIKEQRKLTPKYFAMTKKYFKHNPLEVFNGEHPVLKDLISKNPIVKNGDIVLGPEYYILKEKNIFHSKSDIFPLKEIFFEDGMYPCVNNIQKYLTSLYGDFMAYPKKISLGHTMYSDLTSEEKEIVKELSDYTRRNNEN